MPRKNSKKIITLVIVILVFIIAIGLLELTDITHFTRLSRTNRIESSPNSDTNAQSTSDTPSAQPDYTDGDNRDPGNSIREDEANISVEDNNGEIDKNIQTNNPITSNTGEITVYSPGENALVKRGSKIVGISKLNTVSYRVVDSKTGVIASGRLNVIDGKFSGTLTYTSNAPEGRIDIYGTKDNLAEFSNIKIPIRFR